jgi:hypothetical protein
MSFDTVMMTVSEQPEEDRSFTSLVAFTINECGSFEILIWPPEKLATNKDLYIYNTWVSTIIRFEGNNSANTDIQIETDGIIRGNYSLRNTKIFHGTFDSLKLTVGALATYNYMKGYVYGMSFSPMMV